MLNFDEKRLKAQLTEMPSSCRLAFAVAVAFRQLPSYERYTGLHADLPHGRPRQIIEELLNEIDSGGTAENWPKTLEEIMDLIPQEDAGDAGFLDLLAQHGLSALAYSVRYLLSGDAQEATWAGLCEYEAADQAAIRILRPDFEKPEAEMEVLSHKFVQGMLQAQNADLQLLKAGQINEVLKRARENPTFSEAELDSFA